MSRCKLAKSRPLLFLFFLAAWLYMGLSHAEPLVNQLKDHPSPYLALHGHDPVAWQEWNADTVARARRENKLLYVSVGYFACHWCHVMQRESYRNPEIAALLNRYFIPVKVDRELNNGLDDALQNFSERMSRIAGWPLNAFVTPEGYPAFVVLYVPPEEFSGLLQRLAERWRKDGDGIRVLARQAAPVVKSPGSQSLTPAYVASVWQAYMNAAWQEADTLNGGFGQVSKFPMAPQLALLLEGYAQKPDQKLGGFLRSTLDQMAARALRDHVGGGFFRYTTDPSWDTPHFEKMLYDNAQLALLYFRAAEVLGEPRYRNIALESLDFMRTELQDAAGGLYSSTSAVDEQGREGAAYLWEPAELKSALSPEGYAAAVRVWRLDRPRMFEYGYLPAEYQAPTGPEAALLQAAYVELRGLRQTRRIPKDDKMNAGLNGLALSAFRRGQAFDPAYRQSADRVRNFLVRQLIREGRLMKAKAKGQVLAGAELEDYAHVVRGLLDDAQVTGNAQSHALAVKLARTAWSLFWTESGWKREARPLLAALQPEPVLADGALASPSEILILASLQSVDAALVRQARRAAAWHSVEMQRDPFAFPTRIRVLQRVISEPASLSGSQN
jgi:hypothetical protein